MRKFLTGAAILALVAAAAEAKPGGGGGGGGPGGGHPGGNPHAGGYPGGGGGNGKGHGGGGGGGGGGHEMRGPAVFNPGGNQGRGRGPDREQFRPVQAAAPMRELRGNGNGHGNGRGQAQREAVQVQRQEMRQRGPALRDAMRGNGKGKGNYDRGMVEQARIDSPVVNRMAGRGRGLIEGCPPGLAKKGNGCTPPGLAAKAGDNAALARAGVVGAAGAGVAAVLAAQTFTPSWFGYDNYGPDYRYYDGYLLRTNGDNVLGYVPLLGGALSIGAPWQSYYQPEPISPYWADYYDLDRLDRYRYYDDVIYEVDPRDSEIDQIVALMSGDPWAVGRPMPVGYDVYNVPYTYRDRYLDGPDHWYRYSDGYVYDVDPTTRLVSAVIQLLT